MNAALIDHSTEDHDPDAMVSASVKALAAGRGVSPNELASALQINPATFYAKQNGSSPWKVRELVALADYFAVAVTDLLDGLGGLVNPTSNQGVGVRKSPVSRRANGASESLSQRVRLEGLEPPTF